MRLGQAVPVQLLDDQCRIRIAVVRIDTAAASPPVPEY